MVEKRKLSTRARIEVPPKKRASTPPAEPSPSASASEGLPTSFADNQPLPTLHELQTDTLTLREYQSISERQKWLTEGIFERYWTKPSKKKNQAELHNPQKDTMIKVGPCTVTIEPHVFEATIFTVKEPQAQLPFTSTGQSMQRPMLQYGPYPAAVSGPSATLNHSIQIGKPPLQAPPPGVSQSTIMPPIVPKTAAAQLSYQQPQQPPQQKLQTVSRANGIITKDTQASPNVKSATPKPSPDPVIQMLATKAATDHELKALMRVVASGQASPEQLKVFQKHIDDLTTMLHSQNNAKRNLVPTPSSASPAGSPGGLPPSGVMRATPNIGPSPSPNIQQIPSPATTARSTPTLPLPPIKTEISPYAYTAPPPLLKSKGPPLPSSRSEINAVVLEFSAGCGDRFLFPKYSILEYLPGRTQVIVSFLLVRKGSANQLDNYDPDLDFYQPVTMRLAAQHVKVLEPLAKVVISQLEVRKYMDNIMDNMTRAEYVHLATRLPRNPEELEDDEEEENFEMENVVRAVYPPPSSLVPMKKKTVKKPSILIERSSVEPWASPGPGLSDIQFNRKGRGKAADPNKTCNICHTASTSLWRKAEIDGESVSVCNACGIKWKTNSLKSQETTSALPKKMRPAQRMTSPAGLNSNPISLTPKAHPYPLAVNSLSMPNMASGKSTGAHMHG
ncbi:MAG: hypothetical protein M1827_002042 [Pycnora praestabilis]|nr:MAG: hypothetical protein M1827_002042 [Pycnora praestabilis]